MVGISATSFGLCPADVAAIVEGVEMVGRRWLYRAEGVFGLLSTALCCAAIWAPTWIESVVGADPDGGNGSAEWGLASVALLAAVVLTALSALHRSRWHPAYQH